MSDTLSFHIEIQKDAVHADLVGRIDEDANFDKLLEVEMPEYIFNFEKITLINSCGIREWINFLSKLPTDAKIHYENCGQIIIEQMNMVHGFIKEGAIIESFYAPYFCEECDIEKKVLLNSNSIEGKKAPVVKCDQCQNEMEFDAIEDQYFNFLNK